MADEAYDEVRTVEYRLAVEHELNQKPGKLYPLAGDSAGYQDKGAQLIDRFGHLDLEEKQTRNEDTNNTDVSVERRFIKKPKSADVAPLIDRDDQKATKVDLGSPIAASTGLAVRRYHDKQWIKGYFGNGWTGEDGDTAVPFDSNNIIDLGGNFTKAGLLAIREAMNLGDVDTEAEMPIMLIDPQSETKLLQIEEYVNKDYTADGRPPLMMGEIKDWLGFRFVKANLKSRKAFGDTVDLLVPAANHIALPVFVPSGLHRGIWTEFWGKITERNDKKHSTQIYAEACSAVVRTDEAKCFQYVVDHSV
ncbi:MAG: phage capsid protein [Qipengyuania citrea]|uniref:phage capsid protein n=1 Tax=Qipengyuania citrea TaxID=225971 RepID=UPI003265B07E